MTAAVKGKVLMEGPTKTFCRSMHAQLTARSQVGKSGGGVRNAAWNLDHAVDSRVSKL